MKLEEVDVNQAIDILLKLATLGQAVVSADSRVLQLIRNAQDEDRDLTDEEIQQFIDSRKEAMSRWDELMDDVPE